MGGARQFSKQATDILKQWLFSDEHVNFPYPNVVERKQLAERTGMSPRQVLNWFVNARKRLWQPLLQQLGLSIKDVVAKGKSNCGGRPIQLPKVKREVQSRQELLQSINVRVVPDIVSRKGQWSIEECAFADKLIECFWAGVLPIDRGTTLRTFLAAKMNCSPMRISKKYAGSARLGKSFYTPAQSILDHDRVKVALAELHEIKHRYEQRLERESLLHSKVVLLDQQDTNTNKSNTIKVEKPPALPIPRSPISVQDSLDMDTWFSETSSILMDHELEFSNFNTSLETPEMWHVSAQSFDFQNDVLNLF